MKKKARLISLLSDVVIVLFCLGVCGLSLLFFWKDLNKFSTRSDKNQIASIYFKHKIAQRKFNDRVVWERLSQNAPLYNEDTLRTADFAQAIIRFKDGTVLDLYENTMLQIFYSEEEGVKINVDGGDIRIDSSEGSKNVTLAMDGGSVVKLDAGSKMVAKINHESEVQNFEIQTGSAAVVSDSGNVESFYAGESLYIEKDGGISRKPVTVTSISRDLKLLNLKQEPVPVKLEWKTDSSKDEKTLVTVQTSRTKDFSTIDSTFTTDDVSSLDVKADNGTLYWRVYTEDSKNEPVVGKVSVHEVEGIKINSPAQGNEFSYREKLPKIVFSWNGNDYASRYKLEVSKTADFLNPVVNEEIEGTSYSLETLAEGNYFWKVTPFYPLNNIGYSSPCETRNFNIVKNLEIKAPALLLPQDNSKLVLKENTPSVFAWKSDVKDSEYEILVSTDEAFGNVVLKESTKLTRFSRELGDLKLTDGEYFWKIIRHSNEKDDINPESEIRRFNVSHYIPGINRLIYPPEGYEVEKVKFCETKFMWKLADEYLKAGKKSHLQISAKEDFSVGVKDFNLEDSFLDNLKLESGKYFWRVGVESEDKEIFTEKRSFVVLNPLGAPEFTFPENNSVLLTVKNTQTRFTWTDVPGADSYTLKIFDQGGNLLGQRAGIKGNSCGLILSEDACKVSVQAHTDETEVNGARSGTVRSVSFKVKVPEPVLLQEPKENYYVEGLSALRNPVLFSWTNGSEKPANVKFILYKTLSSGGLKEVYSVENPNEKVSVDRLVEGNYKWTVRASTANGIPLDSETRSFTVSAVPVLNRAVLYSPENNEIIGPIYLKKYKSIIFDWQKVPGATDYSFVLYQKKADGSLKYIYSEKFCKNNTIKFKKLSDLDVGDFVWNVTAYSHSKDGFEEQHGKIATGNFKISFELPEKVKTIKPGRMYGE